MPGLWTRPSTAIPRPDLAGPLMMSGRRLIGLVAHQILVPKLVDKRLDNFDKIDTAELMRLPADARAKAAARNRMDLKRNNDNYACEGHGLELPIPWEDQADRPGEDHEGFAARTIAEWIALNLESTVATMCTGENVWTASGTTGKTVSTAWDVAGGTPYADVQVGVDQLCKACCCDPSDLLLVLPLHGLQFLPINSDYRARMQINTQAFVGRITEAEAAAYFGVGKVVAARGEYNSANRGATASISRLWPNTYAFLCLPAKSQEADLLEPQLGRTFVWPGFGEMASMVLDAGSPGSGYDGLPMAFGSYVDDRHSADVVCVDSWYHAKRFDTTFGYSFKSIGT